MKTREQTKIPQLNPKIKILNEKTQKIDEKGNIFLVFSDIAVKK